jgi:signal peptidase I
MNLAVLSANKKQNRKNIDFSNLFFVIAVLFIITRVFFWGTYKVEGHSMDPTLKGGNYLVTINYFTPQRGDLVTAKEDDKVIIKRVIGLPNDTIEFKNDKLYINEVEQDESYLNTFKEEFAKDRLHEEYSYNQAYQTRAAQMAHFTLDADNKSDFKITLKDNEYYLLGDNRPVSKDSREVGAFSRNQITGKVIIKNINPF